MKNLRRSVLRLLKTQHRRYRVQENKNGAYRVQCNDTVFRHIGWQTMGRRDGRGPWNPFISDELSDIGEFVADDRRQRAEDKAQTSWKTTQILGG